MKPNVILHNAVSVDGRMTGFNADLELYYGLAQRWGEDATLAGVETVLHAYPPEQVNDEAPEAFEPPEKVAGDTRPLLVIPDSRGRLRTWHLLRREPYWRDVVALCSEKTPASFLSYLRDRHVETVIAGGDHVDMRAALLELNTRFGVRVVRVDSGGTLNGVLLNEGLVDEISVLVHPELVGGTTVNTLFKSPDRSPAQEPIALRLTHLEQMKDGIVWMRYEVQ